MNAYPRELRGVAISERLNAFIHGATWRLIDGPTHQHELLRRQLMAGRVESVELTGVGLIAKFAVPESCPLVEPAELIGGEGSIAASGLDLSAGCLVKVAGGRLAFLEVYTFGAVPWPDEPTMVALSEFTPLEIPSPAS